ncbi:flagellar biosynthetic protein FliR [Balneatrix alpica]|uniref:Flagellar biosynthetic protein FliR n=1 Tax=Balneatrix alpica TaxID=75684 RepID=A0ABV5ZE58_9GAMM|nr:flagellar biosynthetic protein FliR [Balneatrix alpica]
MISLDLAAVEQWVLAFLLPFFRVTGFVVAAPIFGARMVPARVKVFLVLAITLILVPIVPEGGYVGHFGLQVWLQGIAQLLIGILLGFVVQILFQIVVLAGQFLAMQMGLGFAAVNDPVNGMSVVALSQFYLLLSTLLFLVMNGHLVILGMLADSFVWLPVGQWPDSESFWRIAQGGSWMFASALSLALPGIIALGLVNFAFGIITKAAPQLNIFAIGFPFTLIFGLFIFWAGLVDTIWQHRTFMDFLFNWMPTLIGGGHG